MTCVAYTSGGSPLKHITETLREERARRSQMARTGNARATVADVYRPVAFLRLAVVRARGLINADESLFGAQVDNGADCNAM